MSILAVGGTSWALSTLSYIAQLVPPTARMLKTEKSLNQKIMHISNNTFPQAFLYRGKEIGLPQYTSLKVLSHSARYRTACKTLRTGTQNKAAWELAKSEYAHLSIAAGLASALPHWDSPPLIDLVTEACKGFVNKFEGLKQDVQDAVRAHEGSRARSSIQKVVSEYLLPQFFPVTFAAECVRRLLLWLPADHRARRVQLQPLVEDALGTISMLPKSVVVSVVKVWCNGLPTNFRLHKENRACIWCRLKDCHDRLSHVCHCPVFWQTLSILFAK